MEKLKPRELLQEEALLSIFYSLNEYSLEIANISGVSQKQCFSLILGIIPDLCHVFEERKNYGDVSNYLIHFLDILVEKGIRLQ